MSWGRRLELEEESQPRKVCPAHSVPQGGDSGFTPEPGGWDVLVGVAASRVGQGWDRHPVSGSLGLSSSFAEWGSKRQPPRGGERMKWGRRRGTHPVPLVAGPPSGVGNLDGA